MWTIFKVFIRLVTVLLLLYIAVFWLVGMWGPSSPTGDQISAPCIGRQSLNHWPTREVLYLPFSRLFSECARQQRFSQIPKPNSISMMATHSSILTWRIPWTEEPGRLQSTGSQRVGHDWVTTYLPTYLDFLTFPSHPGVCSCVSFCWEVSEGETSLPLTPLKDHRTREPCKHWHRPQLFQLQSQYLILSS